MYYFIVDRYNKIDAYEMTNILLLQILDDA